MLCLLLRRGLYIEQSAVLDLRKEYGVLVLILADSGGYGQ